MAVLIGMSKDVKGKTVEITESISIGRRSDNILPVDNSSVSGHHCEIVFEDNQYQLRDLGSTNGTRVNHKDVTETTLRPKDIVQVGSVEFMFDASPGEMLSDKPAQTAKVEIAPGPAVAPSSFGSISPFGTRKSKSKGLWFAIIAVLAVVVIVALVLLFMQLTGQG